MKVLHSAALLRPPSGIINQMRFEQKAADKLGLDWDVKLFCPDGWVEPDRIIEKSKIVRSNSKKSIFNKVKDWFSLRYEYHRWLKSHEVDVFVLRYYVHDPFQLYFAKTCKKPVFFVHHTLEGPELAMPGGITGWIRSKLEVWLGRPTIAYSQGIIGVTQEIIEYEKNRCGILDKQAILYPNGVLINDPPVEDKRSHRPEFLFVAGHFSPWHGLDLLLNDMANCNDDFILHLVGEVPGSERALAEKDDRIILHGMKTQNEIRKIAMSCWFGLSSFALHRNNMRQACTLKVREYLMMGLPVVAGYDEVFTHKMNGYYKKIEPSIHDLLRYAKECPRYSRSEVVEVSSHEINKENLLCDLHKTLLACQKT